MALMGIDLAKMREEEVVEEEHPGVARPDLPSKSASCPVELESQMSHECCFSR